MKNGGNHLIKHRYKKIKKSMVFAIIVIFVSTSIVPSINGASDISQHNNATYGENGSLIVTLESTFYTISHSGNKAEVEMEGFGFILEPGCPRLPSKTFLIGVPPGGEVISIELVGENQEVIPGHYDILPVPPVSDGIRNVSYKVNEEVYSSSGSYPSDVFEYLGMSQLRKYSFARVKFCPVLYSPSTGKLVIYREIILKVNYQIVKELSDELLSDGVMDDVASRIIVNYPSICSSYIPSFPTSFSEDYNYVIITTSSLENSVKFFKNWKELIGYSVKVVNISWIYSNYAGSDEQEKIRNFLIDNYASWGIKYVLIIGSHNEIPMRYCYEPASSDDAIPTDYYYADLTGDWDSDNDGIYAEFPDDSADFVAEVWVGRIPFDTSSEVLDICQKTINFEQDNGAWKKKALLLGTTPNFQNEVGQGQPKTDGANLMEELWTDVFHPNGYSRTTMYEKEGLQPSIYNCDYPLNHENVVNHWSEGYGAVNWLSHGSSYESLRKWWKSDDNINNVPDMNEIETESFISSFDTADLNDDKPSIVFSCSCSNSDPRNQNNLGKNLLGNGAVAFVGATYYAFYFFGWDDKNDGGMMSINYYFFDHMINSDQTCAEALYNSLLYCWNDDEITSIYVNMLVFCLYGDPSVSFETFTTYVSSPNTPIKPSGPESITPHVEYSYSTSATDSEGYPIYYIWDWGDESDAVLLGPYDSGATVRAYHEWTTPGNYRIRVKTIGVIGDESNWSEPLTIRVQGPVIKIESITGGLFKVNAEIKNAGDVEANDIEWKITIYGGTILLGKHTSGRITSILAGEKTTVVSSLIYGFGLPVVVTVEAGIPGSSPDVEVQSADVILFVIRIE